MPGFKLKYQYGFHDRIKPIFKTYQGLNEAVVRTISEKKREPQWMLDYRLKALNIFWQKALPKWGADLSGIEFDKLTYYSNPLKQKEKKWADVPSEIKDTFDKLGIPEAEKKWLAGVESQYDSEVVYGSLKKELSSKGVIFLSMDEAVKQQTDKVRQYFGTVIAMGDNKFSALNSAVWSGGSFVYIPKGVKVERLLQAYFRINAASFGQFERTLIVAEEGSQMHYSEGCFVKGSRVLTSGGYKEIEKIKIGDDVVSHKGRFKKVYKVQRRKYQGKLYKIQFYGDSSVVLQVTKEHPFLSARRRSEKDRNKQFNAQWRKPIELKEKDYLIIPRLKKVKEREFFSYKVRRREFAKHGKMNLFEVRLPSNLDFFRLVGYYLAEGSVDEKGYLKFSFGAHEKTLISDAKNLLRKLFPFIKNIHEYKNIINHGLDLIVGSVDLARAFVNFGNGAANKKIPLWMMFEVLEKQKELIKGYFRGDGNYYHSKTKNRDKEIFRMNTVSRTLAYRVRDLLIRLGIPAFINKRDRSKEGRQEIFTIGVSGEAMVKFGKIVGIRIRDKIHGHRRASMFGVDADYVYLPIKKITSIKVRNLKVYNFSVKEDESYLIEGIAVHNCTAPAFTESSLHAAVVEIVVKKKAKVQYTTVQNWYKNIYNLVTKRAWVGEDGEMIWTDANLGSKVTMKYPGFILAGKGARGETLSVALAGKDQHLDVGSKAVHLAENTKSLIVSKSISLNGGRNSYRGLVQVNHGAKGARSKVICDALILDSKSRSDTYPTNRIMEQQTTLEHEATVSKVGEEQLFYLMSRGLTEGEARSMVVNGFIEPVVRKLPLEYAVEMNRLIELSMEGSVG
ncbi:MAG: SufD family Fe-S cluster assembly protein [Patescibacteria group bacterium]|nr:SufD family Fe-S cluster assembly protein [Patescibacteria group bacterium]